MSGRRGNRQRQLGFALTRGPFEQQRLLKLGGQKDNLGHHRVDEVPGCLQSVHQVVE